MNVKTEVCPERGCINFGTTKELAKSKSSRHKVNSSKVNGNFAFCCKQKLKMMYSLGLKLSEQG